MKNRWPPMSKRHPSRSTERLIPPTTVSSSTTTTGSPDWASWRAAVRPAGPPPITTTGASGPVPSRPNGTTGTRGNPTAGAVSSVTATSWGPFSSGWWAPPAGVRPATRLPLSAHGRPWCAVPGRMAVSSVAWLGCRGWCCRGARRASSGCAPAGLRNGPDGHRPGISGPTRSDTAFKHGTPLWKTLVVAMRQKDSGSRSATGGSHAGEGRGVVPRRRRAVTAPPRPGRPAGRRPPC